jgi:hypothetical protein
MFQESTRRRKDTMDLTLLLLTKIKMETGCLLETFHGSKFHLPWFFYLLYRFSALPAICFPKLTRVLIVLQYVYLHLQEAENYEGIRS